MRSAASLRPVRVLLVDGLSAELADRLPAHQRLCAEGLRLQVDVGFPAVSLPVQHVLWTGAWQAESGVAFAVERLPHRLLPSLPELIAARSGQSVAVSESHREVVASFPFSRIVAPPERSGPMEPAALRVAALREAQSSAALVLVHTLSVDDAGHFHGALSSQYLQAARRSDELLGALLSARRPEWTVLALADHGHLAEGGHGDVESEVRFPRACLAGPGIPAGRSIPLGLPDLTTILAERLGVDAPAASRGHRLADLLAEAEPATPPETPLGPRRVLLAMAALALLAALLLALRARLARTCSSWRKALLLMPWSFGLEVSLLLCLGPPSLSRAFVYPALSPVLLAVGVASGLLLALQLATARSRGVPAGTALVVLVSAPLAATLATVCLGGWPLLEPPLVPLWSAWASSLLEATATALWVTAAAWLVSLARDLDFLSCAGGDREPACGSGSNEA